MNVFLFKFLVYCLCMMCFSVLIMCLSRIYIVLLLGATVTAIALHVLLSRLLIMCLDFILL